jgi:hypothetical protein
MKKSQLQLPPLPWDYFTLARHLDTSDRSNAVLRPAHMASQMNLFSNVLLVESNCVASWNSKASRVLVEARLDVFWRRFLNREGLHHDMDNKAVFSLGMGCVGVAFDDDFAGCPVKPAIAFVRSLQTGQRAHN